MRRLAATVAAAALIATAGCAENGAAGPESPPDAPGAPPGGPHADPELTAEGLEPLAKADGWRDGFDGTGVPFAVLEIAYDRDTADQAWRDNVPEDLPEGEGDLEGPVRYGDLDRVDFAQQAVVVWSAGESGTCPAWLADLSTEDGVVALEQHDITTGADEDVACTMDYRPYRMVAAVDLDRLPDPDDLPITDVTGVPDAEVASYPAR